MPPTENLQCRSSNTPARSARLNLKRWSAPTATPRRARRATAPIWKKLLSIPAVKSDSTHALALNAAKKRDAKQANQNARVQREYELHHND